MFCNQCFRDEAEVKNLFSIGDDEYICNECSDIEGEKLEQEYLEAGCTCSKSEPACGHPHCLGYWS